MPGSLPEGLILKRKALCCTTFNAQPWHDKALTCGNKVFAERAGEPPSEPWGVGGGWWCWQVSASERGCAAMLLSGATHARRLVLQGIPEHAPIMNH
jgi:hypothetical protein